MRPMKIITILQARLSSSRLFGKVLLPILGEPMLLRQIERIKRSKHHGQIVVATSMENEDQAIAICCKKNNLDYSCGNLKDVLDRFYHTAKRYQPEHVVRLTGDCPLIDPSIIDYVIETHLEGNFDYTSNALQPTYPDGLDVEIMRFSALEAAWREAILPSEREHVTPFIYSNKEHRFRIGHVYNNVNLSHLRWTVDEREDFNLVTHIYEMLYPDNVEFTTENILCLLEKYPELKTINLQYERNEGMQKSLQADTIFLKVKNNA